MILIKTVELTVKEYAAREQVDQRTVWRWIAKGALLTRRTPGGRLRIVERRDEPRMKVLTPEGPH